MATNNASNNTYYRTAIAFSARISSDNANMTGDGTIVSPVIFDTCDFGCGYYNNATGLYSAPIEGYYRFESTIWLSNITFASTDPVRIWLAYSDGSTALGDVFGGDLIRSNTDYDIGIMVTDAKWLTVGQTAQVAVSVSGGTKIVTIKETSFFSGFLLGETT